MQFQKHMHGSVVVTLADNDFCFINSQQLCPATVLTCRSLSVPNAHFILLVWISILTPIIFALLRMLNVVGHHNYCIFLFHKIFRTFPSRHCTKYHKRCFNPLFTAL